VHDEYQKPFYISTQALWLESYKKNERAQVINLDTSNLEVEQLKILIREKIKHTYLDKYIQPAIDYYKLSILTSIMNHTSMSDQKKEKYIITTMLVQIALDTHDLIPITNDINEAKHCRTSRQLTVLAGDYFSGLYYLVLSEIEEIEFTQLLATTIKEINELKMKRYYKEVNSFEEFIEIEQKIESLLITRVASFMNLPSTNKIIGHLLITNKLVEAKVNFHLKDQTHFLDKWITGRTPNTYTPILDKLDLIIEQKLTFIKKDLIYLPTSLQNHMQSIVDELVKLNHTVTEEG